MMKEYLATDKNLFSDASFATSNGQSLHINYIITLLSIVQNSRYFNFQYGINFKNLQ